MTPPWHLPLNIPPEALQELSKTLTPTGIADYSALAIFSVAATTYLSRGYLWDQPDPYQHLVYERPQLKNGESNKDLVVFWGSQSGTAEGFANRLAREISLRFGLSAMTADLSDYDPETIAEVPQSKLVGLLLSTYGEGDPSDNTAELWDWVNKTKDQGQLLSSVRYFAFGLGNRNYKYYNRVVDVVVEALDKLGATAVMPVGKADDAEGATQEDFMTWKESLFAVLKGLGFQEHEVQYMPTLSVQEDESLEPIDLHHGEPDAGSLKAQCSPIRPLAISTSRELFNSSNRHCLHIDLDLTSQPEFTYKTGDHLAIWPGNPDSEVERLLQALGLSSRRDVPISIKSLDSATKVKIPSPTTVATVFRYYLEICGPVNRDNVLGLAQFAPTPDAKAYLQQLGQDKASYAAFINKNHVNLGRLLQQASTNTWNIPLSYLVETLPLMQPRYYSISSSSIISPRKASITVVVSTTPVPENGDKLIHGVTSNYLLAVSESLRSAPHPEGLTYHLNGPSDSLQGGKLLSHLRKSKFKLPTLAKCPLIMVAAGTGLAPFRAFIAERRQLQQIGKEADEDFIYRDELDEMTRALGEKLRIVTAYSREGNKQYVQDKIPEVGDDVYRLIDEGANFYICGKAEMAREVEKAVAGVMSVKGQDEANEWRTRMKRRNKWQEDVW
ncbi:NADPH cytochrome P450 [Aspergillus nomiae NRRL 13137]|uniref:NADPH--cytochrome P450 reductase n=1 Tax=Aspergillus nomiae NRRL (strain ATCC 15546 / NRRL 13137 / CBS 260.88 / M93) TaxID=1509407 RepID=A0A0L1IQP6_ASPN3|nr:NADPH cytochrome P450 [Aspergillus nomiae NRRL 13137]KNG81705.1 NADPH cytochrome P450 [Aspergillus nomiae NRRL 13137]